MTNPAILSLAGFALITIFMILIMTKRVSAVVGLILVPLIFVVLLGRAPDAGTMILDGMKDVAPTAAMLIFAIFYFGIMIDAGLFEPLVKRIVKWVGDDPLRAIVGHVALVSIISLDGDGTTTLLVTVAALYPVFVRLRINLLIFATVGGLAGAIMNMTPWGGPSARVAAVLGVQPNELFVPLLPSMAAGLASVFILAWWLGLRERNRLALEAQGFAANDLPLPIPSADALALSSDPDPLALRPKLVWFNFILTAVMMIAIVLHLAPIHAVFAIGTGVALLVNYPKLSDQRARLANHAGNILNVAVLVLAAGAFTGVLQGSGMIDAMAASIVANLPQQLGPHLGLVTAILASPMSFFLPNDAYYFGILPVIAETGKTFGLSAAEIGRASLMGLLIHGLSPLVAAVYLKCAIINIDLADLQKFALKYYLLITGVMVLTALFTGAIGWGFG